MVQILSKPTVSKLHGVVKVDLEELNGAEKDEIVLVIVDSDDYEEANRNMIRYLTKDREDLGVYVTVNKPCIDVKNFLEDDGISLDRLFFVDAISKQTCGIETEYDNVIFLDSPEDLTGMSIVISETLESMGDTERFVFLDSISTLEVYNEKKTITKFAHYLTGKMRSWDNVSGIVLSLRNEVDEQFIQQLSQFCDRKIEI